MPRPWEKLGAVPEMLQTAWGCLFKSLALQKGEQLFLRAVYLDVKIVYLGGGAAAPRTMSQGASNGFP